MLEKDDADHKNSNWPDRQKSSRAINKSTQNNIFDALRSTLSFHSQDKSKNHKKNFNNYIFTQQLSTSELSELFNHRPSDQLRNIHEIIELIRNEIIQSAYKQWNYCYLHLTPESPSEVGEDKYILALNYWWSDYWWSVDYTTDKEKILLDGSLVYPSSYLAFAIPQSGEIELLSKRWVFSFRSWISEESLDQFVQMLKDEGCKQVTSLYNTNKGEEMLQEAGLRTVYK